MESLKCIPRRKTDLNMAKNNYKNIERIGELLNETGIPALQKEIAKAEKRLAEALKKLAVKEEAVKVKKAEALAKEEEAKRAEEEKLSEQTASTDSGEGAKGEGESSPAPAREKTPSVETENPSAEKKAEDATAQVSAPAEQQHGGEAAKETAKADKSAQKSYTYTPITENTVFVPQSRRERSPRSQGQGQPRAQYDKDGKPVQRKSGDYSRPQGQGQPRTQYDKDGKPVQRKSGDYARSQGQGQNRLSDSKGTFSRQGGARTPLGRNSFSGASGSMSGAIPPAQGKNFNADKKKKTFEKTFTEKKPLNKRAMIKQEGLDIADFDDDKSGYRKARFGKKEKKKEIPTVKIERAVVTTKEIPIKVLSEKIGVSAVEITKKLFKEGIMKSVNESIDYDNAALLALDLGIELEYNPPKTAEDLLSETHDSASDNEEDIITRPPVVTVMGHVDHGKTSLLDKIRSSNVTAGEAGGITQNIGAYTVTLNGKQITFIDTPGHAAFTAMRARGAKVTDIVVLVVAADDGIMPQTIEAINHAKAANVPIIVAMNKMDKPNVNPDKVKQGLLEQNLVPEEWGGDTIIVPVSAKTGDGITDLLENILLVAEMQELKANPKRMAKGTIIEAKLDKGKGPVASVIIQNGTLHTGDNIISGTTMGRVRAMFDDKNRSVKEAGPSMAVNVLGLEEVPSSGDSIFAVEQSLMKQVQEERETLLRESMIKEQSKITLDDVFAQVEEGKMQVLNLIVKADVQGSAEAVKSSVEKLSNDEIKVKVIHSAAGAITESDVMLADSANAIIVGFNVRPDTKAKALAESSKVDVRLYRIIYELIDDMEKALKGMLAPKFQEILTGKCEVRQTFNITNVGLVAGCYVTDGKIIRGGKLRIYRDDVMIVEGNVRTLKRFKDDVKEVAYGFECGCAIDGFNEIRIGDVIECYITQEIKQD